MRLDRLAREGGLWSAPDGPAPRENGQCQNLNHHLYVVFLLRLVMEISVLSLRSFMITINLSPANFYVINMAAVTR